MARALQATLVLVALSFSTMAHGQNSLRCSVIRAQQNGVVIAWEAAPGRSYTLEETSSLHGPWRPAGVYLATTNRLAASLTISERTKFFRILQPQRAPNLQSAGTWQTGYAFDPRFANYYQNSAEVPQRVLSINQQLKDQGLLGELAPIEPVPDAGAYIAMVHTPAHIQGIHSIPIDQGHGATEPIGVIADLATAHVLGAVRDVCEGKIRNAFCNIRPPGHHQINSGYSYGFCCHANAVIAGRFALERYPNFIKRVMIVDWDYHHGNGTQFFVGNDPAFLFYDTCAGGFYSGGDESHHGLMTGNPGNDGFLREWENEMLPLAKEFKPDLILICAGFDSKKGDLMGGLGLTARGYSLLTRKVMDIADAFSGGRVVSILEGGYADNNGQFPGTFNGLKQAVENHVRTLMTGELQPETPFF
ncbi:MAG: histone deacetylase [Verrucomicrobia bacterium]|nr:histone deacetylase [Verrucomicrobiota bacterium]